MRSTRVSSMDSVCGRHRVSVWHRVDGMHRISNIYIRIDADKAT